MSETTRPVLGYLTTTWTPPASCLAVEVFGTSPPSWQTGYAGVTCAASNVLYDATDCWPPRTANAPNPTESAFLSGWGFYSPGTVCPSGYTTACRATYGIDVSGGWELQFPLTTGETAAGCCPSGGYTCYYTHPNQAGTNTYGPAQSCRLLATSTVLEVAPCTTDGVGSATLATMSSSTEVVTTGSTTSVVTSSQTLVALAPLIQVNWRAEDLSTSTSSPPSSGSSTTSPSGSSRSTLSGGAIAGIAIGAIVALVGIAIGILWFVRRSKNRTNAPRELDDGAPAHHPEGEYPSQEAKVHPETQQPYELPMTDPGHPSPGQVVINGRFLAEVPG